MERWQFLTAIIAAIFGSTGFWGWLSQRKASNKTILEELRSLRQALDDEKKEREQETVSNMRWFLLSFAQECRKGEIHNKEQWTFALNRAKQYESFCKKHSIDNGVIEADTGYIRSLYQELSKEHKL